MLCICSYGNHDVYVSFFAVIQYKYLECRQDSQFALGRDLRIYGIIILFSNT